MNWLKRLFVNDWYPVWADNAYWDVTTYYDGYEHSVVIRKNCSYEIVYSPLRKRYKIVTYGRNPKVHPYYQVAVKKLLELKANQLLTEMLTESPIK